MCFHPPFAETRKTLRRPLVFLWCILPVTSLSSYTIFSACDDHHNKINICKLSYFARDCHYREYCEQRNLGGRSPRPIEQNLKQLEDLLSSAEGHALPPLSPACYPK